MNPESLLASFPLPEGWSPIEIAEDVIDVAGLSVRRAGVSSVGPGGEEILGSAADVAVFPLERGYFELLERVAIHEAAQGTRALFASSDAPERWRYARSNGVALHRDWETAALRARWELAERDRILRAWYGETAPVFLSDELGRAAPMPKGYSWHAYSFPSASLLRGEVEAVGVFGFPEDASLPLALGFAARPALEEAVRDATREALQLLAFLWGEPTPAEAPPIGPSPAHHRDRYQFGAHRPIVRDWLSGAHLGRGSAAAGDVPAVVSYVDLTPTWLGGGLRVVKATSDAATPLTFGLSPFGAHLPPSLQIHPIA